MLNFGVAGIPFARWFDDLVFRLYCSITCFMHGVRAQGFVGHWLGRSGWLIIRCVCALVH